MAEEKVVPLTAEAPTYAEQAARISNMEESLNNLQAKLAASEETVREYVEAVRVWEIWEGVAHHETAGIECLICSADNRLRDLAANPPDGASALSEVVKLRSQLIAESKWVIPSGSVPERYEIRKRTQEMLADAALGERSTSEGEGS